MAKKIKILLVEDEPHLAQGLEFNLQREGYLVVVAGDGEQALQYYQEQTFDLMILDVMLPLLDGYQVAQAVRKHDQQFPLLMLSAKSQEEDRIKGLELGVDDYLTKPFHLQELLLRVKGMIRRQHWYTLPQQKILTFGKSQIDFSNFQARGVKGENFSLTRKEALIMKLLWEHQGSLVSRDLLLSQVWGYDPGQATRTVDIFIARLRKYFEPDPKKPCFILTVRGKGYRLSL